MAKHNALALAALAGAFACNPAGGAEVAVDVFGLSYHYEGSTYLE